MRYLFRLVFLQLYCHVGEKVCLQSSHGLPEVSRGLPGPGSGRLPGKAGTCTRAWCAGTKIAQAFGWRWGALPGCRDLPTGLCSSAPLIPSSCSTSRLLELLGKTLLLYFCFLVNKCVVLWVAFLGAPQQETSKWGTTRGVEAHKDLGIWVTGPELGFFQEISYKEVFQRCLSALSAVARNSREQSQASRQLSVPTYHYRIRINAPRVSPRLEVTAPQAPSPPFCLPAASLLPSLHLKLPSAEVEVPGDGSGPAGSEP